MPAIEALGPPNQPAVSIRMRESLRGCFSCAPALVLGVLSWFVATSLFADSIEPIDVARIDSAPKIDGRLDESLWNAATLVDDFVARAPIEGAAPSVRTEVRFAYSRRALYVGLRAYASDPQTIRATTVRRDDSAVVENDQFALAIDTFHDLRSGYWFSTNPLGVRVDAQFSDEGERWEENWDGIWNAAAQTSELGWSAELEIPWATVRFPVAPDVVMGINLFRRIPVTNEQLFAPLIPVRYSAGTPSVSIARTYRFRGIAGGTRFDLRPFAIESRTRSGPDDRARNLDGGFFARYSLTEALTVSGTLHADFSEVEVDDAQLNLTRFPLFLPEKRDFFLESAGSFAFGAPGEAELFFSRSIGLVENDSGVATVPLDWGVKGTGRLGRLELGLLSVKTGDAQDAQGARFDVARTRLSLGGRSFVGGFFSRRDAGANSSHTTSGLDFNHFFPREIRLQGFAANDRTVSPEGNKTARAWFVSLSKGGEELAFDVSFLDLEPEFDPAVGLLARPGTRRFNAALAVPWLPGEPSTIRRIAPSVGLRRFDDLADSGFDESIQVGLDIDWRNDFRLATRLLRQRELLFLPFTIYRDVAIPAGRYDRWEVSVAATSSQTREVNFDGEVATGGLYDGRHLSGRLRMTWRPSYLFSVTPSVLADRVALRARAFTAWTAQLRLGLTPSSRFRFDVLGQYESERRDAGVGLRARYDFREGTELILAWDSIESEDPLRLPGEPRRIHRERGALKATYLVRL